MSDSSPDPRFYKDGNGLKPRLRMLWHHPRWYLWCKSPRWFKKHVNQRRDRRNIVRLEGPMRAAGLLDGPVASPLGWHVISGEQLLAELQRVEAGEKADLVFAELWANADHERIEP